MAFPVINPDTGVSLEYRHLIQGPYKDIWIKALAAALQHRYLHTPLQPVGDKQFAAIQAQEIIFCPNIQQQATQAPIHPPMKHPEIAPLLQQIQPSASVDLSPPLQEQTGSNVDRHRYPTHCSLKKKSYSMACTSKYSYATEHPIPNE